MKAKSKILLTSLATIAMSASLVVGGTYALFTSEDSVNIAVTSGTVKVEAAVTSVVKSDASSDDFQVQPVLGENDEATGDYAFLNMLPGDSATATITITNSSTVSVYYKVSANVEGELAPALEVSSVNEDWEKWTTEEGETKTVSLTVAFPDKDDNNLYQGKEANIGFKVEAVQGNAYSAKSAAEVNNKIANAKAGETVYVELENDIETNETIINKNANGEPVNVVFDGNGHTITATDSTKSVFCMYDYGTVSNVTITGNGQYAFFSYYNVWGTPVDIELNNVTVDMKTASVPIVFSGKGVATMNNCTIEGAVSSVESYPQGTQVFAGAEMTVNFNNTKVENLVIMNANYGSSSHAVVNAGSEIGALVLVKEQNMTSTYENNGGTIHAIYINGEKAEQVSDAGKFEEVLASAKANAVIALNDGQYNLNGKTVELANGVTLIGDGDAVIENATFTMADDQSASFVGIDFAGTTTIEAKGDGTLKITDCEFNVAPVKYNGFSRAAAIIGANQYYTLDLRVEGCTFNYQYENGNADLWNAAIFMWSKVDSCVIKDCTFNGYGFMAVKLMNVAEGAEIVFEGNTFNMCEATAANYYNNNAVSIQPQHDNAFSVKCINNTFNGAYEKDGDVVYIKGMSNLQLTKCTLTHSGNTVNGVAATDANFELAQ